MTEQRDNEAKPPKITKNVMVLMPFRSGDINGEKQSYLDFLRIKYLVEEKIKVCPKSDESNCIQYKVKYFKKGAGNITEQAFKEFRKNDLFIALITETNVNVIYEIAVLNVLQEELIILVDIDETKMAIPVYIENYANIPFFHDDPNHIDNGVKRKITSMANDPNTQIYWDDGDIDKVPELKKIIDEHDKHLQQSLQKTIKDFEFGLIEPPAILREIAREFHPSKALSGWTTFIPYSVVKIDWSKRNSEDGSYSEGDLISAPEVVCCNPEFCLLMGKNPEPEKTLNENTLTSEVQINFLKKNMEPENYSMFIVDQARIFQEIFLDNEYSQAWVPIEFDSKHKYYKNKVFLPTLIARKEVGVFSAPHSTYYIIAFIEDFFPQKDLPKEKKVILKKLEIKLEEEQIKKSKVDKNITKEELMDLEGELDILKNKFKETYGEL